jgi:hypothetical protein
VSRADHDHVSVLVLGDLGQRSRGGDAADDAHSKDAL